LGDEVGFYITVRDVVEVMLRELTTVSDNKRKSMAI
jgi:hypothetical protein